MSSSVSRSMRSTNAAAVTKFRPLSYCLFPSSLYFNSLRPATKAARKLPGDATGGLASINCEQLRTSFADALARAGTCRHDKPKGRSSGEPGPRYESSLAFQKVEGVVQIGHIQQGSRQRPVKKARHLKPLTKKDYLKLLDFYQPVTHDDDDVKSSDGGTNSEEAGNPLQVDMHASKLPQLIGDTSREAYRTIVDLLTDDGSSPEEVYQAYTDLPSPGVRYLSREEIRLLLRKLSVHKHKNHSRTFNFFAVLDDLRAANMDIPTRVWNSALHLGARTLFRVRDADVEASLQTWKDMENTPGVRVGPTTFNILFDIAVKSGRYALSELILGEMKARGYKFNRYTRVGMIFRAGERKDGDGVREAYREYVNSGEIVDVVVLTCVITSLISAGEPAAAEAVYYRMKDLAIERETKSYEPRLWTKNRELASILSYVVDQVQKGLIKPEIARTLQSTVSLAPNLRTCNTLLRHFCEEGELHRAVAMLDEMQEMELRPNNRTFRALIEGFDRHGGVRYTTWTAARLESVWESYKTLLEVENMDLYITKWMALYTLSAFRKCCGVKRQSEIWDEIKSRWRQDTPLEVIMPRPLG